MGKSVCVTYISFQLLRSLLHQNTYTWESWKVKKKKKNPKVRLSLCPHPPPAVSMLRGPYPTAPAAFRALLPEIQLSDLLFLSGSHNGRALCAPARHVTSELRKAMTWATQFRRVTPLPQKRTRQAKDPSPSFHRRKQVFCTLATDLPQNPNL